MDGKIECSFAHFIGVSGVNSSTGSGSNEAEEEVETTVRILFSRPQSSQLSSKVGECRVISERQIPTVADTVVSEGSQDSSSDIKLVAKNEEFTFHKTQGGDLLAIEPIPGEMQVPTVVEGVLSETSENPTIETTVDLMATDNGKGDYSSEVQNVDTDDDTILHEVHEKVPLEVQPILDEIQTPIDLKDVILETSENPTIETTVDLMATDNRKGDYSSEVQNVDTDDDTILHEVHEKVPLEVQPILDEIQAPIDLKDVILETSENPTIETTVDLMATDNRKGDYSSEVQNVDTDDDTILHEVHEKVPLEVQPILDEIQAPIDLKDVILETSENPTFETTVDLMATDNRKGDYSSEVQNVDTDDDTILHEVHEVVSLEGQPILDEIQAPIDLKDVILETSENPTIETTVDLMATDNGKGDYSSEVQNVDTDDDTILHEVHEVVSLEVQPILDETQAPIDLKDVILETSENPTIETTVDLMATDNRKGDYSSEVQNVDTDDDTILHEVHEKVPLEVQPILDEIQASIDLKGVMSETCENPTIETTVDLMATDNRKGDYSSEVQNVDTDDDTILHEVHEKVPLEVQPILDEIQASIDLKGVMSETCENPTIETTVDLMATDNRKGDYSSEVQDVEIEHDTILHEVHEIVSLEVQPILDETQAPIDLKDVILETSENPTIETTVDLMATDNRKGDYSSEAQNVGTDDDTILHEVHEKVPLEVQPILDEIQAPIDLKDVILETNDNSTIENTIELMATDNRKGDYSSELQDVEIEHDIILHEVYEDVSLAFECNPDSAKTIGHPIMKASHHKDCHKCEMQIPSVMKAMFPDGTETSTIEPTGHLLVPEEFKGNHPNGFKHMVNDDEFVLHKTRGAISLVTEPIQHHSEANGNPALEAAHHDICDEHKIQTPKVKEVLFPGRTRAQTIEFTIDVTAPEGCEGRFPNAIKIVVTDEDLNCNDKTEDGSALVTEPILDHCDPVVGAFDHSESYKQTVSGVESRANGRGVLCETEASEELDKRMKEFEINGLKKEIIFLNNEAKLDKAELLTMRRKLQQRKLGEDLRVRFIEKKEKLEKDFTQARLNLRYQIEKNRRLEFKDELRESVIVKFDQVQKDFNELKQEHAKLLAERSKSMESGDSNVCERNERKAPIDKVNK